MFDLYPQDPIKRAQVLQWMSWLHLNSRQFSRTYLALAIRGDYDLTPQEHERKVKMCRSSASLLDKHLKKTGFLVGDSLTLCDILLAGDMIQCRPEHLNLFDFSE